MVSNSNAQFESSEPAFSLTNDVPTPEYRSAYALAPGGYFYKTKSKIITDVNDGMAPACISAISETDKFYKNNKFKFNGYDLQVYPLYTEFKNPDHKLKDTGYHIKEKKPEQKPKRGKITRVSKKSAINLKKRISRMPEHQIWIDFTFPNDVMANKTVTQRAEKSYYFMKRLIKYAKENFGIYIIWKRENKPRKSGELKNEIVPHFHTIWGGLNENQLKNWISICLQLLFKWVEITGTKDSNAIKVAINKKSYRKIENPKHAIHYIAKYFSKDDEINIPEGESIGRCWGTSNNCPEIEPYIIRLNQDQSFKVIRHYIRKKKLNSKNRKFIKRQLQNGYSTFLFEDEVDIGRYLNFINVDMFPHIDPIPF
ncbi:MAG: hypothetical protein K8S18_13315 [Desulfobacula sp.]|nr:hypothetical protein [Desulfobacula sp.]